MHRFVRSLSQVTVHSLSQRFSHNNQALFEGEVELCIDDKMHIWADRAFINRDQGTILLTGTQKRPLLCEYQGSLITAQKLHLDLVRKSGFAESLTLSAKEGIVMAARAEKSADFDWQMHDIVYTPCNKEEPDWHIRASHASIRAGYFLTASWIVFKIGSFPIFALPYIILPLQGQSTSGFLMPRFFFDYHYGFGFRQEYYHAFTEHADTTFAFDWRDGRGVVFSDELRYASSENNYLNVRGHYAIARDMLAPVGSSLFKQTKHRYWIKGEAFWENELSPGLTAYRLGALDFGTDKRIGYHFFNTLADVDNIFYSYGTLRLLSDQLGRANFLIDHECARYKQFSDAFFDVEKATFLPHRTAQALPVYHEKERHDELYKIPQFSFSTGFKRFEFLDCTFFDFLYKQDFFIDHVINKKAAYERVYYKSKLIDERFPVKEITDNWLRIGYQAELIKSFSWYNHLFSATAYPELVWRSLTKTGRAAAGLTLSLGATYTPGEACIALTTIDNREHLFFIKPELFCTYAPRSFLQTELLVADSQDCFYEKKVLGGQLSVALNGEHADSFSGHFLLRCAYDGAQLERRPLYERALSNHWQPLLYEFTLKKGLFSWDTTIEWDPPQQKIMTLFTKVSYEADFFRATFGFLHMTSAACDARQLLAPYADYVTIDQSLMLSDHVTLSYTAQLFKERGCSLAPLIHKVALEYKKHCWSLYCAYEEKRYKEYGHPKRERIFSFAIKFDVLGSFAKRVRNYEIPR